MKSKTEKFISSLSDEELSVLKRKKYFSYMKHGRLVVDQEIEKRKLTVDQMDTLYEKAVKTNYTHGCIKCGSIHLIDIEVGSVKSGGSASLLSLVALFSRNHNSQGVRVECQICGTLVKDDSM